MKRKRKALSLLICLCLLSVVLSGCEQEREEERIKSIRIGIALYDSYDTFIGELITYANHHAMELEQESGVVITLMIQGADGSQELQNSQVEGFIESGCDVICANVVDRTDVSMIIDKAEAAGIPVVFFNRELVEEDLNRNDNLFYVGAEALESGRMQGEIVVDYCREHRLKMDKNGDGMLQYVMLEGEAGHQDAIVRTEYAVQTIVNGGLQVERLESEIANWVRSQAESKMKQWLDQHGMNIELVLANNDDMALGAIDALKRAEIPREDWPVVVGIDGTSSGRNAVLTGEMLGTVYNDSQGQGEAMIDLAFALATDGEMPETLKGKYIRLPYQTITIENVLDFVRLNEN